MTYRYQDTEETVSSNGPCHLTLNRVSYLSFAGLVSKVFPSDQVIDETIRFAEKVAAFSPMIVQMAKQAVNAGNFFLFFSLNFYVFYCFFFLSLLCF